MRMKMKGVPDVEEVDCGDGTVIGGEEHGGAQNITKANFG